MELSTTQRSVLRGIVVGAGVTIAVVAAAIVANPLALSHDATLSQRLSVAVGSATLLAVCLAASIGRLARHRFFAAQDIDGAGLQRDSERAAFLQSLLQNTLEQTALATIVYLAWAVTMPARTLSVVPIAAVTFTVGRILFFRGYNQGAAARALGFALTFYPSLAMLLCNGVYLLGTSVSAITEKIH